MEVSNQPKLMFHGVDFVNIKFDTFQHYDNNTGIDLKIEPKVFYPENEKTFFKIFMELTISCKDFFNLNVVGIGNFEFNKEFEDEVLKKTFVNANAPAIMFPYVRSFVSTLTSNLGNVTGTLTIPTQFFQGDLPEITVDSEDK
jgi:preprotein translocase subunit SecB